MFGVIIDEKLIDYIFDALFSIMNFNHTRPYNESWTHKIKEIDERKYFNARLQIHQSLVNHSKYIASATKQICKKKVTDLIV